MKALRLLRSREGLNLQALKLLAGQFAAAALGATGSIVAARILGPARFGQAAVAIATATTFFSFAAVKTVSVSTKHLVQAIEAGDSERARSVFQLGMFVDIASGAAAAAGVLAFILLTSALGFEGLPRSILFYGLALPLGALASSGSMALLATARIGATAVAQCVEPCVSTALTIAVVAASPGVTSYILVQALALSASGVIWLGAGARSLRKVGVSRLFSDSDVRSEWRRQRRDLGANYVSTTTSGLSAQLPVLAVGAFAGSTAAGYMKVALTVSVVGGYVESSLARPLYPELVRRSRAATMSDSFAFFQHELKKGVLIAGGFVVGSVPLASLVVPLFYGRQYKPAVLATLFALLSAAPMIASYVVPVMHFATGRVARWAKRSVASTSSIAAAAVLAAPLGPTACTVAMATASLVARSLIVRSEVRSFTKAQHSLKGD